MGDKLPNATRHRSFGNNKLKNSSGLASIDIALCCTSNTEFTILIIAFAFFTSSVRHNANCGFSITLAVTFLTRIIHVTCEEYFFRMMVDKNYFNLFWLWPILLSHDLHHGFVTGSLISFRIKLMSEDKVV